MALGLSLIARNEQDNLPALLASIEGAFDHIALLDTGSTDDTVGVFRTWAAREQDRNAEFTYVTDSFEWCDDFGAARRAADALLLRLPERDPEGVGRAIDWIAWADCDDVLRGASQLRQLAAGAPREVVAFVADYEYAHDTHGNCVCVLKRERLVRAGHGTWDGRVHEAQSLDGPTLMLDPAQVCWVHRKPADAPNSSERNLALLEVWERDEPENSRVLAYMGTEYLARNDLEAAEPFFHRYLALKTGWDEERAQVHRKLAVCMLTRGDLEGAEDTALRALTVLPEWPDSYLTLAQASYQRQDWAKASQWCRRVLALGHPNSLLILNPLDYTFTPRLLLAGALGGAGDLEGALQVGAEALALIPDHEPLRTTYIEWQARMKREHTVAGVLAHCELLCGHDEQLKALDFIERCVPHYVVDDPRIVAVRSGLRERVGALLEPAGVADHYHHATEVGIPEDNMQVVEWLDRAKFLLVGLMEQGAVKVPEPDAEPVLAAAA